MVTFLIKLSLVAVVSTSLTIVFLFILFRGNTTYTSPPVLKLPFTNESGSWKVSRGYNGGYYNNGDHKGGTRFALDFVPNSPGPAGSTVVAPASGNIVLAFDCFDKRGYGFALQLDGGDSGNDRTYIQLCHLVQDLKPSIGRHVNQGDYLGTTSKDFNAIHMALYRGCKFA